MQIANILLDNNQTEKGLGVLQEIINDQNSGDKIREIATVKLATYKIDTAPFAEVEALLAPISEKGGAWAPMAKELLAMSAIQNNNPDKARALYEDLLVNSNISDDFKARVNDMLALINDMQKE